jgi:hypothetical protein
MGRPSNTPVQGEQRAAKIFGQEPIRIIDDIINSVNDYATDSINAVQQCLLRQTDATAEEVNEGIEKLQKTMQESIDKNFDKFELYSLKNIFQVPSDLNIEDLNEEVEEFTEEEELQVDEEIATLRQEIEQALERRVNGKRGLSDETIHLEALKKTAVAITEAKEASQQPDGPLSVLQSLCSTGERLRAQIEEIDSLTEKLGGPHPQKTKGVAGVIVDGKNDPEALATLISG